MAYKIMIRLINSPQTTKTKEELLEMCDVYYAAGRVTAAQYEELVSKINEKYPETTETN